MSGVEACAIGATKAETVKAEINVAMANFFIS
jgi:hypothetical protein